MNRFNQEEFNNFVLDNDVLGFYEKPIELKSKRLSSWYVNWRDVAEDVFLLDKLADYVIAFTEDLGLEPDCFYGVPEGATKLSVITQYKWAKESPNYDHGSHALPMGRGKPKDHGDPKDMYFVGVPRGKTIILEDVTTTGGSSLNTIGDVKELDSAEIIYLIALTNRMELTPIPEKDKEKTVEEFIKIFERATGKKYERPLSVEEAVNEARVAYHALSNALQLLPEAYKKLKPGKDVAKAIEKEFEKYGVEKLILG